MDIELVLEKEAESDVVKYIKSNNFDINYIDEYGYSFLMKSINRKLEEVSIYLINQNANLNYRNKKGQTIVHLLAINYNFEILKSALEKGVDLSIEDIYGNQALWTAVFNDKGFGTHLEMIKLLLQYGSNPYHTNNVDKSPMDFAKQANYIDIIKILDNVPK